jgi:hypothetical protein
MQPIDFSSGNWYRASKYEVIDGCIVPATNATFTVYSPWAKQSGTNQSPHITRAYQSLLELAEKLETSPPLPPPRSLALQPLQGGSSPGERLILQWCSKFGLLGILPTIAIAVRLAPRWGADPELPHPLPCALRDEMNRIGGHWWHQVHARESTAYDEIPEADRTQGALIPTNVTAPDDRPRVVLWDGVLTTKLGFPDLVEEPLRPTWHRFFPAAYRTNPETFQYGPIGSPLFHRQYGEPLWMFQRAMTLFKQSVEILGDRNDIQADVFQAKAFLNLLASATSPLINPDPSSRQQEWLSASLLASFAFMAIQDHTIGHRVYHCKNQPCRQLFISDAPNAQYCSPECRSAFHTRQYRAKVKNTKATVRKRRPPTAKQLRRTK